MSKKKIVIFGLIVTSKSLKDLNITRGFLTVETGKVKNKGTVEEFLKLENLGAFKDFEVIKLNEDQFLMPGLVDCHTHGPQFPNIGLGLDRPLLEWLEKYTFPLERKYSDKEFAAQVYNIVVRRLIDNGTTTACYFGSLHLEGTLKLAQAAIEYGQRALVGKVSMNIENDIGYYNTTEKELEDVESFIQQVTAYKNDLVLPVITPRFSLSCDQNLMCGLAELSNKYDCRIQSHISENLEEIKHALNIHSPCKNYGETYDRCSILHNKCIMAHAIHLTDDEIELLSNRGVSIAHCPASNTRLKSGLCPVRKYLNSGIDIGLGTDVSGGDNASILDALRRSMDVSTHLELMGHDDYSLNWIEAFYLATLGGAKALNLDEKIGSLEVGKEFDALIIDTKAGPIDNYKFRHVNKQDHDKEVIQRFIYLGDDRNIVRVFIQGETVKPFQKILNG